MALSITEFARMGGKARARKLTKQQRSDAARKAVEARWARIDKSMAKTEAILDSLEQKSRALVKLSRANRKRAKKAAK